jgi:uncharacterized damage-inducible protein DinB
MKRVLGELVRHVVWADRRTEASLQSLTVAPDDARRLFVHVVTTEQIYLERMRGHDPFPQDFWPDLPLGAVARAASDVGEALLSFVRERTEGELVTAVRYRNSRGTYF